MMFPSKDIYCIFIQQNKKDKPFARNIQPPIFTA